MDDGQNRRASPEPLLDLGENADDNSREMHHMNVSSSHEWDPTNVSLAVAFLAVSPCLAWIGYEMKAMAAPYLSMHLLSIPLAYRLRDERGWVRWPSALVVVAVLGSIKTSTLTLSSQESDSVARKGVFYALTALWECSNAVHIFGGRTLLDRYGITSYRRALLAVTCPAQIKFVDRPHPRDRSLLRSVHIGGYIGAFFLLRFLLGFAVDFIEQHVVLEAEALAILFSCLVNIWNVPPLLYQLMLMMYPVQVIYPYGSIYLSASSREFWSKWSRPASSLIRHMFYYPLGGSGRAWLSIPLMFLLNASSHFSVSEALVGDKAEVGWLMVFGILGLVATLEVFGNQCFEKIDPENNRTVAPKWWSAIRFLAAVVALRFAAFVLLHECLSSSLSDLVLQTNNS